jgi:hypothetical protein
MRSYFRFARREEANAGLVGSRLSKLSSTIFVVERRTMHSQGAPSNDQKRVRRGLQGGEAKGYDANRSHRRERKFGVILLEVGEPFVCWGRHVERAHGLYWGNGAHGKWCVDL